MAINNLKVPIGTKLTNIPNGEYEAILEKIEEEKKFNRRTLIFTFKIVSGDYSQYLARAFVNFNYETFTEHSKLYKMYFATLGREVDFDETEINLADFYERVLLVKIENKASKKTGNKFGNVTEIIKTVRAL